MGVEAIAETFRRYSVSLVSTLRTRLLSDTGEDVTAPATADEDSLWHVRLESHEILLLAAPRSTVPYEDLLTRALCSLLGCAPPASLSPLLACPPAEAASTLAQLRVRPPERWAAAAAVGAPGTPCSAADEAMLQLRPLRAFFAGEVVAVRATHLGGGDALVYAQVDVDRPCAAAPTALGAVEQSAEEALEPLALRVGASSALMHVLPLHVHSFRTMRRHPAAAHAVEVCAAAGMPLPPPPAQPSAHAQGGAGAAAAAGRSAELVEAVASVLRQAGVPVGLETTQMLESNLKLQADLRRAKAELETISAEALRSKEKLENSERMTTCQICFQRRVDVALNGCGHLLCQACAGVVERCPYCRGEHSGFTIMRW